MTDITIKETTMPNIGLQIGPNKECLKQKEKRNDSQKKSDQKKIEQ